MDVLRWTAVLLDDQPAFCAVVSILSDRHSHHSEAAQEKTDRLQAYEDSLAECQRLQILLFYARKLGHSGSEEQLGSYLNMCDVARQDRIGLGLDAEEICGLQGALEKRILLNFASRIAVKIATQLQNLERQLPVTCDDATKTEGKVMLDNLNSSKRIAADLCRLHNNRVQLTVQLQKRLSEYMVLMSPVTHHLKLEAHMGEATVATLTERTKCLLMELKLKQLEVTKATYPPRDVEALKKVSSLISERTEQLKMDLDKRRVVAKHYEDVSGPEYKELLKEYLRVLKEIEGFKWGMAKF